MRMRWLCLVKGIGLTVIVLGDVGRESEANLHYYSKYHIAYNVPT